MSIQLETGTIIKSPYKLNETLFLIVGDDIKKVIVKEIGVDRFGEFLFLQNYGYCMLEGRQIFRTEAAAKAYLSDNTKENEARDVRPCDVAPMSAAPIRELFIHFMKTGGEDYCSQCAYNGTDYCALGKMTVTDGEAVFDYPNGFGTEPCLYGLYEFYKKEGEVK